MNIFKIKCVFKKNNNCSIIIKHSKKFLNFRHFILKATFDLNCPTQQFDLVGYFNDRVCIPIEQTKSLKVLDVFISENQFLSNNSRIFKPHNLCQ